MGADVFASAWDEIDYTLEEAENMKLHATQMSALRPHITRTGVTQL